jgi:hypothetical protein
MSQYQRVVPVFGICLIVVFAGLPGCSKSPARPDVGLVYGKVTIHGEPLSGTIHFVQDDKADPKKKKHTTLWIRGDGTFGGEVPIGYALVAIETDSAKYKDRDYMLKKWKETVNPTLVKKKNQKVEIPGYSPPAVVYVKIPEKYNDPNQSGLHCEITTGEQRVDFDLTSP